MDREEKALAGIIQGDIPVNPRPFLEIALQAGLAEEKVITLIRDLKKRKVVRRFGAVLRHQQAGYTANAILIAAVGPGETQCSGEALASFREISHCYQREPLFLGKYGIFAMVHSRPGEIEALVKRITEQARITDYILLPSEKELKKTSMELF